MVSPMLDAARRELDRVTAEHGLELEEAVDDDGNLIRSGRVSGSNRRFWLTAHLDADEVEYGEITLSVADRDPGARRLRGVPALRWALQRRRESALSALWSTPGRLRN